VRGEGLTQLYELMARLGDRVGSKLVSRSFPAVSSVTLILPAARQIPMTDHVLARLSDGNSKIVLQVQRACHAPVTFVT
jgi:hypothetical protein